MLFARVPVKVPVVLSAEEVRAVMAHMKGVSWLVVALLYGAGLRLQECLEVRVKDIDFARDELVVRRGKGQKDRRVMLPETLQDRMREHLGFIFTSPRFSGR
jgi:integrase